MAEFRNDDDNDNEDTDDDANYDEDNNEDSDDSEDNNDDNDDEDNEDNDDCMALVPARLICRLSAHSLKICRASTKVLREEILVLTLLRLFYRLN